VGSSSYVRKGEAGLIGYYLGLLKEVEPTGGGVSRSNSPRSCLGGDVRNSKGAQEVIMRWMR